MKSGPRLVGRVMVAGMALVLCWVTSCSFQEPDQPAAGGGKQTKSLTMEYQNFPILDPHRVTWGMWLSASALYESVVGLNKDGTDVEPAAAEKWDVSPDGKTYTFQLRDSTWSDGQPVTAQDFEWSYKRLLSPSDAQGGVTQGANTYLPSLGIKGAVDFQGGALKDWSQVGIKAVDAKTLRFELTEPNLDFLLGMTHPSMLPLPKHVLEKHPDDWQQPKAFVSNGAFVVKSWTVNSTMVLARNPKYWDAANVKLDQIKLRLTEDLTQAGLHFENGEIDLAPLPSQDLGRFKKDSALSKQIFTIPALYSGYLAVLHSRNPALEDVRVREALSLAMGRENLAKTCTDCSASYSLVPAAVDGSADQTIAEDVARAKQLLADAGYPGGKGLPTVNILSNASSPVLEAIADNWQTNLGIKAKLDVVETGVYVDRRQQLQPANYIGFYAGSFSTIPTWRSWTTVLWNGQFTQQFSLSGKDWGTYLAMLEKNSGAEIQAFLDAKASKEANEFVGLLAKGNAQLEANAANETYRNAADVRQRTFLFLPTVYSDANYVVRNGVTGIQSHLGHLLPFYFKSMDLTTS